MEGYTTNNKEMELQDALLRMIRVASRNHTLIEGTVTDVDVDAYTCTVEIGDNEDTIEIEDVSLEVLAGSPASVTFLPVKGSACVLTFRDGHQDRPQMFKIDQIDTVIINPKTKIVLFNGEHGIPLTPETVKELNSAQDDVNNLKDLIAGWQPVDGDGGASLKLTLSAWLGQKIHKTVEKDIASTKTFQ